jgi:hypothetical protein
MRRWRMLDLKKFGAEIYAVSQLLPPEERIGFLVKAIIDMKRRLEERIAHLERQAQLAEQSRRRVLGRSAETRVP